MSKETYYKTLGQCHQHPLTKKSQYLVTFYDNIWDRTTIMSGTGRQFFFLELPNSTCVHSETSSTNLISVSLIALARAL